MTQKRIEEKPNILKHGAGEEQGNFPGWDYKQKFRLNEYGKQL